MRSRAGTSLLIAAVVPAVVFVGACSSATSSELAAHRQHTASTSGASAAAVSGGGPVTSTSPSVASLSTSANLASAAGGVTGGTAVRGPVPSSWEGGHAVPFRPVWWPRGKGHPSQPWPSGWPKPVAFSPTRHGRLSGLVIALDPGHDIGNSRHIRQINATYWVGLTKACNTTGTATNAGYPEATYTFDVVARLRRLLVANGATVVVTRDQNSLTTYGPCVGARGAFPSQEHAAFMVQVHADGGPSSGRGFHVIVPAYYKGYTDDIYRGSRALGLAMAAGMEASGYSPASYLSSVLQVRKDQGAINSADVPTVTVETLNMRNARDAAIAMSSRGRQRIADGLYAGILRYAGAR